jgi:S1-C subfamily serine protease
MKKILLLITLLPFLALSQKSDLSPYKYIYINPLNHQGVDNAYGITSSIANAFTSKGLIVANGYNENNAPQDLKANPCLLLTATPLYTDGTFALKLKLDISNCNNEKVFSKEVSGTATFTVDEAYAKAIKKITKEIEAISYSFNSKLTPEFKIKVNTDYNIQNSGLTEDSIRNYLDQNKIDAIEGIYKSYRTANDNSPSYKFGIVKKRQGLYQAVIIESESSIWKQGEIKMVLENTAMGDIFSVQYYMQDKSKVETFASFSNNLIKIDFANAKNNNENSISSFIKTYPFNSSGSGNISIGGDGKTLTSSGTGFLISESGLLVTNYHVIESGNRITATNTENGKTFELEVVQKDKINDIAILRIKKLETKFPSLPYKLSTRGKNGQNVFTIGYPLNDVMGDNQKVSNGIINSLSGIQDDSRYYQVSVPLQPGNSGGALFDLKGNVIGITTATLNPQAVNANVQNVNYAIKINLLQNLISQLPDEEQIQIGNSESNTEFPLSLLSDRYKMCIFKISSYK